MIFVATAAILKFLSLKIMRTHVRQNFWKASSNSGHHSKPKMNENSQHHNLLGNQISPKSENFCIWQPFYTLVTMATAAILNFFNPLKAATYYGGYSYKVDHNMAPKPWISIPNIKIYLETKFRPNQRIFVFWRPFWIQNGHHSKPTMNINSQHHNLLGNQISPKSEDFCIWLATHYGGYSYKYS
jgi:frataxin-like iron-binding protein CyaY